MSTTSLDCVLCPGGAAPLYPSTTITFSDGTFTCAAIAEAIKQTTDPTSCVQIQLAASNDCCQESWASICDPTNDACPLVGDGICKNVHTPLDPDNLCVSMMADCLDCDPCRDYHYTSCDTCTENPGCYWCPTDALCYAHPYTEYPSPLLVASGSCSTSDWVTTCDTSSSSSSSQLLDVPFSDPLYQANSWAFDLIDVASVWEQGITGSGVTIRINDKGVDASHPEFANNKFDTEGSCGQYLPGDDGEVHGTACASIAAGAGNNSHCSVGIAPGASISSCKYLGIGIDKQDPSRLTWRLDRQDVSSNSFGIEGCSPMNNRDTTSNRQLRHLQNVCPFDSDTPNSPCQYCDFSVEPLESACTTAILEYCSLQTHYEADPACLQYLELFTTCHFNALSDEYQTHLSLGVTEGRNGRGLIFVWASGNENGAGADTNYQGLSNSRYTITVGAVGKDGKHAMYSTPGASLFVTAPGGDFESRSNWITAKTGGGCLDIQVGTSFATPVVAGVVALILEVNPTLGWRDVQGILATTSQVVDASDDSWTTNAAGVSHSYKYGFGVIHASSAVAAASSWSNYGPEQLVSASSSSSLNLPIADAGGSTTQTTLDVQGTLTVESVVVYLDLVSSSRGHLEIRLTSPAGTESILTPGGRPENVLLPSAQRWKLLTVRSWGEGATGSWTLSIVDTKVGDASSCIDLPFDDDALSSFDCYSLQRNMVLLNLTQDHVCSEIAPATDACCFCGGGDDASGVQDQLVSWMIMVYGHNSMVSAEPTVAPASAPTAWLPEGSDGPSAPSPVAAAHGGDSNATVVADCSEELGLVNDCLYTELSLSQTYNCTACVQRALQKALQTNSCNGAAAIWCPALLDCPCNPCAPAYETYGTCLLPPRLADGDTDSVNNCSLDCGWSDGSSGAVPITQPASAARGAAESSRHLWFAMTVATFFLGIFIACPP